MTDLQRKMVGSCMECRKWEEELYWSRFQTVQFCQFLSGRFNHQLVIPKKFANSLREKMGGTVALRGPSGHIWNVGLVAEGDTLLLKHGWKAFIEDHSLEENDILIFKYNGNSRFDVLMFDQESLCEKATSYFVRKCGHTEIGDGSRRKRSIEEVPEDINESPDDASEGHCRVQNPRSIDVARTPPSRIQPTRSTAKSRTMTRKGKRISRGPGYPLQLKSRRREVTEEEKGRAQQMGIEASSDNSFLVVMRASHVYKGFFMSIPAEWAKAHLPNSTQDIVLRVKENTWLAKYLYKGYGGGLTGGWKMFVLENFLEEFDVCVFDLPGETHESSCILDVKIFRVVEEVIPPARLTRGGSRVSSAGRRLRKNVRDLLFDDDEEEEE